MALKRFYKLNWGNFRKMSQIDKGQPNKNNQKMGEAAMVATPIFILSKNK